MQIQQSAALTWLSDEVRQTLSTADTELAKLANAGLNQTEQSAILNAVRGHIDSCYSAFDLTGCDALCRYCAALIASLDNWLVNTEKRLDAGFVFFRLACQHLGDFLRLKQKDASFCELALYADYAQLCELSSSLPTAHPVQLWGGDQKNASTRYLSDSLFLNNVQTDAVTRLGYVSSEQLLQIDVNAALLTFIRQRDSHAAQQLRLVCDQRSVQSISPQMQLYGYLLGCLIEAIEKETLEFDVVLKRTLLQNLAWLKHQSDDVSTLGELIFYIFLAWQNAKQNSVSLVSEDFLPQALSQCAEQAQWAVCKGVNYNRHYLGRHSEAEISHLRQLISDAQRAWTEFSAQDAAAGLDAVLAQVVAVMQRLYEPLVRAFKQASYVGQEMQMLLADASCLSRQETRIELAAMLMVIDGLISDTDGLEDSSLEDQWAEVARRLRCARLDQPAGAYAPWMLAKQRQQTTELASRAVVKVIESALQEAEIGVQSYWQTQLQDDLLRAKDAIGRIVGAAYTLQYEPFEQTAHQVDQQIDQLIRVAHDSHDADNSHKTGAEQEQALMHGMASLSLLLSMYSKGTSQADASTSLSKVSLDKAAPSSVVTPIDQPELPLPAAALSLIPMPIPILFEDDEPLSKIFLEELGELLVQGRGLIQVMTAGQGDHSMMVDVRRIVHTIKGSAKTAELIRLGDVAWKLEQRWNAHLADELSSDTGLVSSTARIFDRMTQWAASLNASAAPEILDQSMDYSVPELEPHAPQLVSVISATPVTPPTPLAPIASHLVLPDIALPANWLDLPDDLAVTDGSQASQVKTIGHLELSIALFNAYLNEADEWSRQMALALSEWAVDDEAPIPSQTLIWAHSLSGSSATVNFLDLAALAKVLEQLIERVMEGAWRPVGLAQAMSEGAEEIRRLLHQFAAGFLKPYDPDLLARLHAFAEMPVHQPPKMLSPEVQIPVPPVLPVLNDAGLEDDLEIMAIFAEEGQELVTNLDYVFRQWSASDTGIEQGDLQRQEALRLLHTLKGSARLARRQDMADLAHQMESDLELQSLPASAQDLKNYAYVIDRFAQLLAGDSTKREAQMAPAVDVNAVLTIAPGTTELASDVASQALSAAQGLPPHTITPQPLPTVALASTSVQLAPAGETIRVKSSTIDRLVNQAGEVMIARSRMESETTRALHTLADLGGQAQRLRDLLRELELQTESQMQSKQTKVSDQQSAFDPLELDRFTRTQELTRFMAEAVSDIATLQRTLQQSLAATEDHLASQRRQAIDMQRYLLSTRMVEFNSISERLMRLVRMTAQELGKSVELTIANGALEMDRAVIERMLPAFEHLLRNAIVHGLESEPERMAKGKIARGSIEITLEQTGKDVRMTVRDDGRGIDEQAVLAKAQALYGDLPTQEPLQLIFASGLSTASAVTELAGRGVGMDVVRAQVQALGGQIDVASQVNVGTTFKLILPLTTAVTQIVLVRTANLMTAFPVNLVLTTLRAKPDLVSQSLETGRIAYAGQDIKFYQLAPLIRSESDDWRLQTTTPVIVLQSASQTIAVHVDEVMGSQEAVVKNLGPQLSQMPGLTGMTVLPTGATVLIYNPIALATVYGERALPPKDREKSKTPTADVSGLNPLSEKALEPLVPLVLIVDDSITMRRVLQRLLQREGYRIMQAADGRQALDLLRVDKPALILSDVEMPRMDGFELLRQIRQSERLQDVPVVMITSRIADKHRDHATQLGANAYLGKPYPEEELLELIERFTGKSKV